MYEFTSVERPGRALLAAALLAAPVAVIAGPTPAQAAGSGVRVHLTKVAAGGDVVGLRGRITAGRAGSAAPGRVAFTLTGGSGQVERFSVRVGASRSFRVVHRTALTGPVVLRGRARAGGRRIGRLLRRTIDLGSVAPAPSGPAPSPSADGPLVGTFRLTAGSFSGGKASGTYFRMLTPGSNPLTNYSSTASDSTYTLLRPGSDGGLRTGVYQPTPAAAFDANGNARGERIIQPQPFFGIAFSVSTQAKDPQTGAAVPVPQIVNRGGRLSGRLEAWSAQWSTQYFNQGSPKPDGSSTGFTTPVKGTYDSRTRRFELEWGSLIVGGPFNSFGGTWHLEGTFVSG